MSAATATRQRTGRASKPESLAELLHRLGDVPASRVRFQPYPATEADVLTIQAREDRLFELVDGVLVEKAMGFPESLLAMYIGMRILGFARPRKLGIVVGADGMMKLSVGLIRIPDASFISWKDLPGGKVPKEPVPRLAPTLAIEVQSPSNTVEEIKRKRKELFKAGTSLMWVIDPKKRSATVWTSFKKSSDLTEDDALDGGNVLPGFKLPLHELFAELDEESPR